MRRTMAQACEEWMNARYGDALPKLDDEAVRECRLTFMCGALAATHELAEAMKTGGLDGATDMQEHLDEMNRWADDQIKNHPHD